MGLKELKKVQREKEFEEYLMSFGITKNDLCYLHEALEIVKRKKDEPRVANVINDEQKKEIEKQYKNAFTAADLVKAFEGQGEEFYPDGNKPSK